VQERTCPSSERYPDPKGFKRWTEARRIRPDVAGRQVHGVSQPAPSSGISAIDRLDILAGHNAFGYQGMNQQ